MSGKTRPKLCSDAIVSPILGRIPIDKTSQKTSRSAPSDDRTRSLDVLACEDQCECTDRNTARWNYYRFSKKCKKEDTLNEADEKEEEIDVVNITIEEKIMETKLETSASASEPTDEVFLMARKMYCSQGRVKADTPAVKNEILFNTRKKKEDLKRPLTWMSPEECSQMCYFYLDSGENSRLEKPVSAEKSSDSTDEKDEEKDEDRSKKLSKDTVISNECQMEPRKSVENDVNVSAHASSSNLDQAQSSKKFFKHKKSYLRDDVKFDEVSSVDMSTLDDTLACNICGKRYLSFRSLKRHRRDCGKTYRCMFCNYTSSYESSYYRHKKRCPSRLGGRKINLQTIVTKVHTDVAT